MLHTEYNTELVEFLSRIVLLVNLKSKNNGLYYQFNTRSTYTILHNAEALFYIDRLITRMVLSTIAD